MKRIFALLLAAVMLAVCVPVMADDVVSPIGKDISGVNAPYLTAGGNPSQTNFLTSADFASHTITILNVWSNNCGPCVNEMPHFQRIHEEFGDRGVLIVGVCSLWINSSYAAEWNLLQANGYTYMNVIQDTVLYNLYSVNQFVPQTFIVNSEGIVVDYIAGSTNYNNLYEKVATWLGEYSDEYYDVSYVDGLTGEVFETQSVHIGQKPVYPAAPEHEGYTFSGWDPEVAPYITEDTTITANYRIDTYRVRFYDSLTGDKIATKYVQYGNPVEPPAAPEHEGYVFVGWDQDLSFVAGPMDVYTVYEEQASNPYDIDGDGTVTSNDALMLMRGVLNLADVPGGDINGDGVVDLSDAILLMRIALGLNG